MSLIVAGSLEAHPQSSPVRAWRIRPGGGGWVRREGEQGCYQTVRPSHHVCVCLTVSDRGGGEFSGRDGGPDRQQRGWQLSDMRRQWQVGRDAEAELLKKKSKKKTLWMDDRLLRWRSQGSEREAQVHRAEGRHSIPPPAFTVGCFVSWMENRGKKEPLQWMISSYNMDPGRAESLPRCCSLFKCDRVCVHVCVLCKICLPWDNMASHIHVRSVSWLRLPTGAELQGGLQGGKWTNNPPLSLSHKKPSHFHTTASQVIFVFLCNSD